MAGINLIDSVKNGIVGTIKGTGEIINAVTDTVGDVLANALKGTGKGRRCCDQRRVRGLPGGHPGRVTNWR